MSEPIRYKEIDIDVVYCFVEDKAIIYDPLSQQDGHILPKFNSRYVTREYIEGVSDGKYYGVKTTKFSPTR